MFQRIEIIQKIWTALFCFGAISFLMLFGCVSVPKLQSMVLVTAFGAGKYGILFHGIVFILTSAFAIFRPQKINNLVVKVNRLEMLPILGLVFVWTFASYPVDSSLLRRMSFSIFIFPVFAVALGRLVKLLRVSNGDVKGMLILVIVAMSVKWLPGGYLPPYFGGIAGWKMVDKSKDPIYLWGLKFYDGKGEEVWFSNAFISPQNFLERHLLFRDDKEKMAQILQSYIGLYQRAYPLLLNNLLPNQAILGRWAYPGHNPYRILDYSKLPPENIRGIKLVTEIYDRKTRERTGGTVTFDYSYEKGIFVK